MNKLLVIVGSSLATDGMLLACTPSRFATLRTLTWMPGPYNAAVGWLAGHQQAARVIGGAVTLTGALMMVAGVMRTPPLRHERPDLGFWARFPHA